MSAVQERHGPPGRIILASASPRRRELLQQIGIESVVVPADIDEGAIRHDSAAILATELARAKALAVAMRHAGHPELAILAADTVVVLGHHILEKPDDREDAARMLRLLSGETHDVITGVAVIGPEARAATRGSTSATACRAATSRVTFAPLSDAEVEAYLDSGEWRGVAGAYRIQGLAARHITGLEGSYSNVVGLPLDLVYSILTG